MTKGKSQRERGKLWVISQHSQHLGNGCIGQVKGTWVRHQQQSSHHHFFPISCIYVWIDSIPLGFGGGDRKEQYLGLFDQVKKILAIEILLQG